MHLPDSWAQLTVHLLTKQCPASNAMSHLHQPVPRNPQAEVAPSQLPTAVCLPHGARGMLFWSVPGLTLLKPGFVESLGTELTTYPCWGAGRHLRGLFQMLKPVCGFLPQLNKATHACNSHLFCCGNSYTNSTCLENVTGFWLFWQSYTEMMPALLS